MNRNAQSYAARISIVASTVLMAAASGLVACGGGNNSPSPTDVAVPPKFDVPPKLDVVPSNADLPPVTPDLGPDTPSIPDTGAGGSGGNEAGTGRGGSGGTAGLDGGPDAGSGGTVSDVAPPDLPADRASGPDGVVGPEVQGEVAQPVDGAGVPVDGGGGGCPTSAKAWSYYPIKEFKTVAWDRDGTLVTAAVFYPTVTSFGGKPVTNAGSADLIAAKLDPTTGNATWVFTAGDPKDQVASGIAVTGSNLVVIGNFTGTVDIDPVNGAIAPIVNPASGPVEFVLGLNDADGTGAWSKKLDLGTSSAMTPMLAAVAGNPTKDYVIVCGAATKKPSILNATGTLGGGKDVVVAALKASDGTVLWAKLLGGAMDQSCATAAMDDTGNVYLAGTYAGTLDLGLGALTPAPTGAQDQILWVAKLSGTDGTTLASTSFGTTGFVLPTGLALDPQGAPVVVGSYNSTVTFGSQTLAATGSSQTYYGFTVKLDASTLAPGWSRGFTGGGALAGGNGIATDSHGNITVVGAFATSLNVGGDLPVLQAASLSTEPFVATLDGATGRPVCAQRFGDPGSAGAVAQGVAINRYATTTNKDRMAAVGLFTKVIDFGGTTTPLSITTGSVQGAFLIER